MKDINYIETVAASDMKRFTVSYLVVFDIIFENSTKIITGNTVMQTEFAIGNIDGIRNLENDIKENLLKKEKERFKNGIDNIVITNLVKL